MSVNDNVNKAREQATQVLGGAVEQARTPLLAVLGAGDLAAHAVADTVQKMRTRIAESAESARTGVNDLPQDVSELRGKLDPAQLREVADSCAKSAMQMYGYLADRGEGALEQFRSRPEVQRAESSVEGAVGDARELADDVLGKVSQTTRSVGEKMARSTEKQADTAADTAERVGDEASTAAHRAGADAASVTRSAAQKTANKADSAKTKSETSGKTGQAKSGGKSTSKSGAKQPKPATRKTTS